MSLMAWYPFDGNIQNYGVGSLSLTQTTTPTYNAGKLCDKSLASGGFKWTAAQAASILNNEAITIAFWIKPLNTSSSQIFGTSGMTPPNNRKFSIFAYPTGNDLHWSWQNDGSNTFTGGTITGCLPVNTWTHVCITYQNPSGKVYINGIQKSTFSGVSASPSFFYETQVIHNSANRLIQDFRVYNHCLSPREANQLSQGLVLHYKLNGGNNSNMLTNSYKLNGKSTSIDPILNCPIVSSDNSAGTSYKDFVSWGGFPVNANEVYTVSFYAKSVSSSVLTMYFYNNTSGVVQVANIKSSEGHNKAGTDGNCPLTLTPQWKKYWVTWTFNATTTSANKTLLFRLAAGGKCDMALPKLERGAIATPYGLTLEESKVNLAQDSSGYNHHGTTVGDLTLSSDSRRYSNSCVFDGSTTGINLPIKDLMKRLLSDKCSINFWVNEANISNRSIYFGGYSGSNFNIEMNGGKLRVYWNGSPDIQTSSVVNNTWTMFTVTIDKATGIKIYKDGVLAYTHPEALSDITSAFTRDFNIGKDSRTDATMMEGKMSDFRIYASVLTQEAITTLYKASISMIENGQLQAYEFNEKPDVSNIKMHQIGAINTSSLSEIGYTGGMKTKVLSDGSAWARIHWLDVSTDKTCFVDDNEVAFCDKPNRFSRMGLVDHFKSYNVPEEYTKLDYIESTGTQYIDTDYYWTSEAVKVYMDAMVTSNSSNQSLFGNEEPYSGGRYFSIVPHGSNGTYGYYVGSKAPAVSGVATCTIGTRFIMECSAGEVLLGDVNNDGRVTASDLSRLNGHLTGAKPIEDSNTLLSADVDKNGIIDSNDLTQIRESILAGTTPTSKEKIFEIKINGTTKVKTNYAGTVQAYANTTSTHATKGKIYIFANHNSSSGGAAAIQNIGGMRLYAFKMYDNGVLVRDFIPCKNKAGTIGLLDRVHNTFYTNPGSGVFTAGPVSATTTSEAGVYEFMLTYPKLSTTAYNRWTQTNSPNASYGQDSGLKKITTAWSKYSSAITKSNSSSSALYSMNSAGNWWAPIGQKTIYNSTGIPAADGSTQLETELWVRIDNLPLLDKISMLDDEYIQAFDIYEI